MTVNAWTHQLKDRDCQIRFKKYDPTICYLLETYFNYNDIGMLKYKGQGKK